MRKILLALALASVASACAFDSGGATPDTAEPLWRDLGHRAFLDLDPSSRIGVTATGPDGAPLEGVAPTITGGAAVLRATDDGTLLVEDLDVTLDDVIVPAGALGTVPIHLTDVSLHLGTQIAVDATWSPTGESVAGSGTGDLLLDWSLVLDDGSPYQLATQKLAERPFQVAVREDATGRLTAAVTMSADGELRQFADSVTLRDLSLAVIAARPGVSSR
jgi:hypothetical protein